MARIWQEGFEDGLPSIDYLEGNLNSQHIKDLTSRFFPVASRLSTGRGSFSQYALKLSRIGSPGYAVNNFTKTLETASGELYLRAYFKYNAVSTTGLYIAREVICMYDSDGNKMMSIYNSGATVPCTFDVYVNVGGSYASVDSFTLTENTWHKIDMYLKINASTGAYEVKINDVSEVSATSVNTGSSNIKLVTFGYNSTSTYNNLDIEFDDLAINDTSGSLNNSWCGNGTIVSLKPKGAGNYSQWDTCEGYAEAEAGTTTTNITITGHGLATNDVIYNKTRGQYRIVTVVDANNLTVASVTGQTTSDVILMYDYQATISNTIGTTTNDDEYVVLVGHNLESGDVFVNTTRSNAIRKVVYVDGDSVFNQHDSPYGETYDLGLNIGTQANGDSIKTFKFKPYAITNHWEAVSKTDPSPKLSYVKTGTLNDIDTYDMEELSADKGLPTTASIVAISHNVYAKEAGGGSEYLPMFRISSTDYAGSTVSLSAGTLQYQKIYNVSPATSSAWTRAEVDGLEAGVKLV